LLDNPFSIEDYIKIIYYLRYSNKNEITMQFSKENYNRVILDNEIHPDIIDEMRRAYRIVTEIYQELYRIDNRISFKGVVKADGSINIQYTLISPVLSAEEIITRRDIFNEETISVAKDMVEHGKITPDMSQKDIALYLSDWVIDLVEYDYEYFDTSYDGYSALIDNLSVCGGYTALYNRMLSIFGVEVYGVSGDEMNGVLHSWTEAFLDGELYYIDTTWNDTANTQKYFTSDKQVFLDTRSWNEEDSYNFRNIMQ